MGKIHTVRLGAVELGAGVPKVIVPIVGQTRQAILDKARELLDYTFDLVEWRVDFYQDALEVEQVLSTLKQLRAILGETPILVTARTREEGGAREISPETYTALNTAVARSGDADIIDVQILAGDELVRRNIDAIHAAGCRVVGSCHSFEGTPDKEELIRWMCRAQELGADVPKVAVMPRCPGDVLKLLDATQEMHLQYADRPIITMSMGGGVVSRLCGEYFGSAATFGTVGQASAPGQIPSGELTEALAILHRALILADSAASA